MSIPIYTDIIERFFSEALDPILRNYVYNGYETLASHLRLPLGVAVVLYITLMGLSISQGWLKLSMSNFIKSAFKIGLIYTFAMNWSLFSKWVVDGIGLSAGQIGDWLISATPIHLPQFAGTGINGAMQSVFIELTKIGEWIWMGGSWHNIGPYFTAALVWIFGYAMIVVALFEIVLAKIMLAILFTTAPLFVCFTLFKVTHGYFDRWLGLIVGFAFLQIFISAVIALTLSFDQWAIAGAYVNHALGFQLVGFVSIMIVGLLGVGLVLKVAQMAQAIGGAVSTASGSELLAGAVGGFIGGAMATSGLASKGMGAGKGALGAAAGVYGATQKAGSLLGTKALEAGAKASHMVQSVRNRLRRGA